MFLRQTLALSYFSRLISAEEFTRQALVETHRREVENARHVAAVMDGAECGERSGQAAAGSSQAAHRLKHEGLQPLLTELRQLRTHYPHNEPLHINCAYLVKRQAQLRYPEFIQQGWPIGSGMVEGANKVGR